MLSFHKVFFRPSPFDRLHCPSPLEDDSVIQSFIQLFEFRQHTTRNYIFWVEKVFICSGLRKKTKYAAKTIAGSIDAGSCHSGCRQGQGPFHSPCLSPQLLHLPFIYSSSLLVQPNSSSPISKSLYYLRNTFLLNLHSLFSVLSINYQT